MKHLTIVTGASRGLGLAIAAQCLAEGQRVLTIARRTPELSGAEHTHWSHDLADAAPLAERLAAWLASQRDCASAALVNNAGVVSQLAPVASVSLADLANALRVGLEAPTLLTAAFLRATAYWAVPRKVALISSGLGRRAMAGSASYCAAKAGLDHLARAVALEEAARPNGARIAAIAPGIIDTDMQAQLRSADPALFAERGRFAGFKDSGALDTPAAAAAKVLRVMARSDYGRDPIADVRDA